MAFLSWTRVNLASFDFRQTPCSGSVRLRESRLWIALVPSPVPSISCRADAICDYARAPEPRGMGSSSNYGRGGKPRRPLPPIGFVSLCNRAILGANPRRRSNHHDTLQISAAHRRSGYGQQGWYLRTKDVRAAARALSAQHALHLTSRKTAGVQRRTAGFAMENNHLHLR